MTSVAEAKARLEVATQAVCEASQLAVEARSRGWPAVQFKENGSPVTDIDLKIERRLIRALREAYPEDAIAGEETGRKQGSSDYEWCCDPLDGTWAFLNGESTVTTTAALRYRGVTILAIVYNPFTQELFTAADAVLEMERKFFQPREGAFDLVHSVVNLRIDRRFKKELFAILRLWEAGRIGKVVVLGGSLAYSLALVARGDHDVFFGRISGGRPPWDLLAGRKLVESHHGIVTVAECVATRSSPQERWILAAISLQAHDAFRESVGGRLSSCLAKSDQAGTYPP